MAYAVIKTSFNSSRTTWDEEKSSQFAYMITNGLAHSTFFPQGKVFETKEDAQREASDIRFWEREERAHRRYGYASYKDRIWVHEVIKAPGRFAAYLPTVGEIKKGMEYIHNNVMSDNPSSDYIDWSIKNEGKSAKEIREELINNYYA